MLPESSFALVYDTTQLRDTGAVTPEEKTRIICDLFKPDENLIGDKRAVGGRDSTAGVFGVVVVVAATAIFGRFCFGLKMGLTDGLEKMRKEMLLKLCTKVIFATKPLRSLLKF